VGTRTVASPGGAKAVPHRPQKLLPSGLSWPQLVQKDMNLDSSVNPEKCSRSD
jgi:hypothetical protein